MASRQERRSKDRELTRLRSQQQRQFPGQVRTTSDGVLEYQLNTADLETPDRLFYANTVKAHRRPEALVFAFAQFVPGTYDVQSAVAVELHGSSLSQVVETFTDAFRSALRSVSGGSYPDYPAEARPQSAISYAAHVVRIALNTGLGVIDFYEVVPGIKGAPDVAPTVRVKAFPPIVRYVVEQCDSAVRST